MAVEAKFELQGLKRLSNDFKKMSFKMQNVVSKRALNTAGRFLAQRTKAKLPSKNKRAGHTGNLRRSIRYTIDRKRYGFSLKIYSNAPHAHLVEYGHNIVSRGSRDKSNRGGRATGRVPAYPFMAPTFDENYKNVARIIESIMARGAQLGN